MRALITGIDGFAGRYLAAHLRRRGDEVHGSVRCAGRLASLAPLGLPEGTLRAVDVCDGAAVAAAVAAVRPQWLFHLAARTFVPEAAVDPMAAFIVNAVGTLHVLAAVARHAPRCRVVVVGSSEVYGAVPDSAQPIVESQPLRPLSDYGASKAAAELLGRQWADGGGLDVVCARPFNHTGPGQSVRFACADFAAQVVAVRAGRRAPRIEVGDLDPVRDLSDVRDVVAAYVVAAERGERGAVYNVCSGVGRRIGAVLDDLMTAAGVQAEVASVASRRRAQHVARLVGSNAALRALGWQPAIDWHQTVAELIAAQTRSGGL